MILAVNYWAVLVSALVSVPLGFIWYGPLFGKPWMRLSGIAMPNPRPPMKVMLKPMIISLIGAFLMAFTLEHSLIFGLTYLSLSGAWTGLQTAFWNWLGFVVPVTLAPSAWEGKSWTLWFINAGYWLALLAIMGLILAAWL